MFAMYEINHARKLMWTETLVSAEDAVDYLAERGIVVHDMSTEDGVTDIFATRTEGGQPFTFTVERIA